MTEFSDVDGAFKSLTDTLQNRLSPFFEEDVSEAWLGAIAHAAAIARQTAQWNSLPETLAAFAPVAAGLDRGARRLAAAGQRPAILEALTEVEHALSALQTLLDKTS